VTSGNPVTDYVPRICEADGEIFIEGKENNQKIPQWVRNIFVWYDNDQISENELLNAIKFLVQQKIIILE